MDAFDSVVNRQSMVVSSIYAVARLKGTINAVVAAGKYEELTVMVSLMEDVGKLPGVVDAADMRSWIAGINDPRSKELGLLGKIGFSAQILTGMLKNKIAGVEQSEVVDTCTKALKFRQLRPLSSLMIAANQEGVLRSSKLEISELIAKCPKGGEYPTAYNLILMAIDTEVEGLTPLDISEWMKWFEPDAETQRKANWDFYQKVAIKVLERRKAAFESGARVNEREIADEINAVREWITTLHRNKETLLAIASS